ncbi:hypothetical protein [Parachitinimonas caeni]|uniref:DUF2846 domain-containing protein n=1 Tax=Parachitinimonas caeni TaxID=3031301 RepID=A0ABT7DWX3_9NEIS|nr:hypothetical protein [Parachitinimonas caeni]MDK2124484.1 hypothetical protein [Parachitinimonas caeni]
MKLKSILLWLAVALWLAGCAASGPAFSILKTSSPNSGALYIYRPQIMANVLISPGIKLDGTEYATLQNGGYMAFEVAAGVHTVEMVLSKRYKHEGDGLKVYVPERGDVFVRLTTQNTLNQRRFLLDLPGFEVGSTEIAACKQVDPMSGNKHSPNFLIDN